MLKALEAMCDTIENEKEYLSELDGAIGDGDHGVNMAKCFREVKKKLAESTAEDIGTLFKDMGMVVMNSVGGAMGALYGTFFMKLSQAGAGKSEVNLSDLVGMLQTGEQGMESTRTCWPKWVVPAAWEKEPSATRMPARLPAILFCGRWHQRLHINP
jgi:dihydroxyacetone kinase